MTSATLMVYMWLAGLALLIILIWGDTQDRVRERKEYTKKHEVLVRHIRELEKR